MSELRKTFANSMRTMRVIYGLTQKDLAQALKVHRNVISNLERGKTWFLNPFCNDILSYFKINMFLFINLKDLFVPDENGFIKKIQPGTDEIYDNLVKKFLSLSDEKKCKVVSYLSEKGRVKKSTDATHQYFLKGSLHH